jgi:TetR/AcrR family transcriptional regulator, regulator of biofilm formation and stress response
VAASTKDSPASAEERILAATMVIIGEQGLQAVTHRAVAREAEVSLGAISHHFPTRDDLLRDALRHAAGIEVARLERLALSLQSRAFETREWVHAMATALGTDLRRNPNRHLAQYELLLACARDPELRELSRAWREAHLRVSEVGLRAAGSSAPDEHAELLTAAVTGLLLKQLAYPEPNFTARVLEPRLSELTAALVASGSAPGQRRPAVRQPSA